MSSTLGRNVLNIADKCTQRWGHFFNQVYLAFPTNFLNVYKYVGREI